MNEMGAGVETATSDINIHVNRTNTETEIDFRIRADSIINADGQTDALGCSKANWTCRRQLKIKRNWS